MKKLQIIVMLKKTILFLGIYLLIFINGYSPVLASEIPDNSLNMSHYKNLFLDARVGLNNMLVSEKYVPVYIHLDNLGEESFSGQISLVYRVGEKNYNNTLFFLNPTIGREIQMTKNIYIKGHTGEDIYFSLPYQYQIRNLEINVQKNNDIIINKEISLPAIDNDNRIHFGIMERNNALKHIEIPERVSLSEDIEIPIELARMSPSSPYTPRLLTAFSSLDLMLIDVPINDIPYSLRDSIDWYVVHGGNILVYDEPTYTYYKNHFHIEKDMINNSYGYLKSANQKFRITEVGSGHIIHISDLYDYQDNDNLKELIKETLTQVKYDGLLEGYYLDYYSNSLNNMIIDGFNNIVKQSTSTLFISVGFGLIYIIALAVGIYYLHKKKKGIYSFYYVSILSVIGSVLILLASIGSRRVSPVINYNNEILYTGIKVQDITTQITAPFGGSYDLAMDSSFDNLPMFLSHKYDYILEKPTPALMSLNLLYRNHESLARLKSYPAFTPENFRSSRLEDNENVSIESSLHFYNNSVFGEIKNNSEKHLKNSFLIMGGNGVYLGDIEPQESLKINKVTEQAFSESNDILPKLLIKASEKEGKKYNEYEKSRLTKVLGYLIKKNKDIGINMPKICSFNFDNNRLSLEKDSGYASKGIDINIIPINVEYSHGNRLYFNQLDSYEKFNTNYNDKHYISTPTQIVRLSIPKFLNDIIIYFDKSIDSNNGADDKEEAKVRLYNYYTNSYDEWGEKFIKEDELSPYIKNGVVMLEMYNPHYDEKSSSNYVRLPNIAMSGIRR